MVKLTHFDSLENKVHSVIELLGGLKKENKKLLTQTEKQSENIHNLIKEKETKITDLSSHPITKEKKQEIQKKIQEIVYKLNLIKN